MEKLVAVLSPGLWLSSCHYGPLMKFLEELGLDISRPGWHPLTLADKARELSERVVSSPNQCLLVSHSFGSIVSHKMLEIEPRARNQVAGMIVLSGVSPKGFEPQVIRSIAAQYPKELWEQAWSGNFRIPDLKIFQALFGDHLAQNDLDRTQPESSNLVRRLVLLAGFSIRPQLVRARFSGPKLFLAGSADKLVTSASAYDWEEYYRADSLLQLAQVEASHAGILSSRETLDEVAAWVANLG